MLPEILVVDAGPIIAAISGGHGARLVFFGCDIKNFATTQFTIDEVMGLLPGLAVKFGIEAEDLFEALALLPLTVYAKSDYDGHMPTARAAIQDVKDVELLALTLHLRVPVWSMNGHFIVPGVDRRTTADLLSEWERKKRLEQTP